MLEKIFEETSFKDIIPIIIASIAIVGFWRGIWGLMDLYLLPTSLEKSYLSSVVIGLIILLGIAFYKKKK